MTSGDITFGERVLLMRRRSGLTQQELATQAGLNKNTIARIEQSSIKDLGGQSVAKIAQALHVDVEYLLGQRNCPHLGVFPSKDKAKFRRDLEQEGRIYYSCFICDEHWYRQLDAQETAAILARLEAD